MNPEWFLRYTRPWVLMINECGENSFATLGYTARLSTEFDEVTCCIHSNYSIQLIVWRHNCAGFRLFHDWVLCLFQICDLFLLICVNKGAIVWHICGESPFHWWFPSQIMSSAGRERYIRAWCVKSTCDLDSWTLNRLHGGSKCTNLKIVVN